MEHEGGDVGLCAYHWKLTIGLIEPKDARPRRDGMSPADVLSPEETELVLGLRALGARPEDLNHAQSVFRDARSRR